MNGYQMHHGSIMIGGPKHGEMIVHPGNVVRLQVREGDKVREVCMVRRTLLIPIDVLVEQPDVYCAGGIPPEVHTRAMNTICDLDAVSLKQLVRIKWLNTDDTNESTGAASASAPPAQSAETPPGAPSPATGPSPTA